jgi:hypothetical protein
MAYYSYQFEQISFSVNFDRSGFGKSTPLAALETGRT